MPELLAPRMPELTEDARSGRVHLVRDPLEARVVRVLVPGDDRSVREGLRIDRDDLRHDETATAPRPLREEVDPTIRDPVSGPEIGQSRGKRDAVGYRPSPHPELRKQVRIRAAACVHAAPPENDGLADSSLAKDR